MTDEHRRRGYNIKGLKQRRLYRSHTTQMPNVALREQFVTSTVVSHALVSLISKTKLEGEGN